MTLMLTAEAVETIKRLAETPGAEGLRISRASDPMNSSGPDLRIELAPAPQPEDTVVEAEGMPLFLDPGAERTLEGRVLHADLHDGRIRFALLAHAEE